MDSVLIYLYFLNTNHYLHLQNKLIRNTLKIIASTVVMSSLLVFALEKCLGYLDYEYSYKSIYLLGIVVFVGIVYLLTCY